MINQVSDYIKNKFGYGSEDTSNIENVGIGGFKTLAMFKTSISNTVEVTDIPLEDGSIISDHVIATPTTAQISGVVSESITFLSEPHELISGFNQSLGLVSKYNVPYSQSAISKINDVQNSFFNAFDKLNDVNQDTLNMYNLFKDDKSLTKVKEFVSHVKSCMNTGKPIQVETGSDYYEKMLITSLITEYDWINNEKAVAFTIDLKEIKVAKTIEADAKLIKNPTPNLKGQADDKVKKGVQNMSNDAGKISGLSVLTG